MVDINSYSPGSGRIIGEDNKIYNLVDLLQGGSGGGSGEQGEKGDRGPQGVAGEKGASGAKGTNGTNGADGFGTEAQYNSIIARLVALETKEAE